MAGSLLGNAVRRVEDPELLHGNGSYVDNLALQGVLHLEFVRSPMAHATIAGVDTAEARAADGVVAVYTAEELALPAHHGLAVLNEHCARPPLAHGKVRFAGDAVAVVVAESKAAAVDAAELVDVDLHELPAVTDPEEALADDAPLQFEELGTNLAAGSRGGSGDDPLAGAQHVVRLRTVNQRMAVVPMEGNAIAVLPPEASADTDLTVYVSTQMPHGFRKQAARLLDVPQQRLRVITPHVGGAFGSKAGVAAEHTVAMGVARRLERPVKWVESRSENLTAMPHGRAQVQYVELGLNLDGLITGMRCRVVGDAGAYAGFGGGLALGPTRTMAPGVYRIPALEYDAAAVLTNTTPVGAFRGAGRPEATAFLERAMDLAAAEMRLDPAELRRRNFLRPDDFPLTTPGGAEYDSGDYDRALTEALRQVGYEDLRAEQASRRERGDRTVLGIGLASYVEITAGGGQGEWGAVTIDGDGGATIRVGTSAHGQGHATVFSTLVADRLGIELEDVRFVQSDTAQVPRGGGTGGSRSLQVGGSAVGEAADVVLRDARELASSLLEVDAEDIELRDIGEFAVRGVPGPGLTWARLATAAIERGTPLAAELDHTVAGATFPFGTHASVVEVDLDTGKVTPLRHVAVDDCGRVLNPLLVQGQQHGGVAQGIAQALWEGFEYDEDGNPQTATLADYTVPTAIEVPALEVSNTETATDRNALGVKGIGESATVGSTPAVQNAVIDALSHLGVRHLDMPCTPMRVWRAVRDAEAGTLQEHWREPPAAFATLPSREAAKRPEAADTDI